MKIAAVQMDIKILDKAANLARILQTFETAAQNGAQIVVFPECALTGYCFESLEEARPLAEPVPGASTQQIAQAAQRLHSTAIVGMLEADGDKIYNAAAVISPEGILARIAKFICPISASTAT